MNNGTRSALTRIYNATLDLHEAARRSNVDVAEAKAYLSQRPGYPGKIRTSVGPLSPRHNLAPMDERGLRAVTLPRVSFLEKE